MSPEAIDNSLSDALAVVKTQLANMRRCLVSRSAASTMLSELRTSSLSPKEYYQLYLSIFDALRHLSAYLYEVHTAGKQHLADLYELVQYAGNIVPRLYLMITVGTVYMSVEGAPIKEIMKDMMEMVRGVQHPMRGLFLRHYLSGMTKDHLPIGDDPGPGGNVQDSIGFVLTNFIEMNKLWVRLQHQGLSRDRDRREMERKDLRILIGTNLVRCSQLDGVDLDTYQRIILPSVLEQVVNCKDVIAQEYLMEVIIQVFSDEFHLRTLGPFLSATAQLHPKVNIKQIVIALIDRLAAFAAREAQNQTGEAETEKPAVNGDATEGVVAVKLEDAPPTPVEKSNRGIPDDVRLFEIFWDQVVQLIKARPDLSLQDITALFVSLANLSLSCYPDRLDYIGQVLGFARSKLQEFADSPEIPHPATNQNLLSLLLAPISAYPSVLTVLNVPNYHDILAVQPYSTRRSIGHAVVSSVLKNETIISTPDMVKSVLELCHVLVRDQKDAGVGMPSQHPAMARQQSSRMGMQLSYDPEERDEEQGWLARMIHLFRSEDLAVQFELLQTARRELGEGGDRIRWTFPPLVVQAVKLARRYKWNEKTAADYEAKSSSVFRFIHQSIGTLYNKVDLASPICLRLYLLALQAADDSSLEDFAYEYATSAFSIYEESISESKAQLQAIVLIIGTLQQSRVFSADKYDTLITKAALHGAKLLKKGHQATAVCHAAHLWWQMPIPGRDGKETLYRDGKRVLECLQKSLRIATSCIDEVTTVEMCVRRVILLTIGSYVDTLEKFIYFLDLAVPEITAKHITSLVELISSQIDSLSTQDPSATHVGASSGLIDGCGQPEAIVRAYKNALEVIVGRKGGLWSSIDIAGPLLKAGVTAR